MPRPRTATRILEMRGAFKANPARKRPHEPQVEGAIPAEPPEHLDEEMAGCWREVVGMVPAGVLTSADDVAVEVVSVLLADFRRERENMQGARLSRLCVMLGRLGLDPSGRAGLVAPSVKRNKFDDV